MRRSLYALALVSLVAGLAGCPHKLFSAQGECPRHQIAAAP